MKIQTIIPIFNPSPIFLTTIIPPLEQQTLKSSLLIINSGTKIPSQEDYEVKEIVKSTFNHANTRNIALHYEADFYLFMTHDATPCDEYLIERLCGAFEDKEVVVAYARQIPYPSADAIEVFIRETNYPELSYSKSKLDIPMMGIKTFFSSDSCAMYRAEYFKNVGGFKKGLQTNEDMEFVARAIMDGKKIAYVAEATVYHSHHFSMREVWRRYRLIGGFFAHNRWILDEVAKHGSVESTGLKQALCELRYLIKKSPLDLPRSLVLSLVKYLAFKCGEYLGNDGVGLSNESHLRGL